MLLQYEVGLNPSSQTTNIKIESPFVAGDGSSMKLSVTNHAGNLVVRPEQPRPRNWRRVTEGILTDRAETWERLAAL